MESENRNPTYQLDQVVEQLKKVTVNVQPLGIVTHSDVCNHAPGFRKECDHVEQPNRVSQTVEYIMKVLSTYHAKDLQLEIKSNEGTNRPAHLESKLSPDIVLLQSFPEAEIDVIKDTHSPEYVDRTLALFDELFERNKNGKLTAGESAIPRSRTKKTDKEDLIFSFNMDMYVGIQSSRAMLLSAGGVIEAVRKVHHAEWRSAFTILRPPGHHSHQSGVDGLPTGFCFFNNVAVAVNYLKREFGYKRILILDWDVHHGDGTQNIFEQDPEVLFVSIHQYDNGKFYPEGSGNPEFIGKGKGAGYSINIGWNLQEEGNELLDEELVYLFETALLPKIQDYKPEFVLVSAGFDSCRGDPLGWYLISPRTYYHILKKLQAVQQKIVVCLEGGYNLENLQECAYSVVASLIGLSESNYQKAVNYSKIETTDELFCSKNWELSPYLVENLFPQSFALEVTRSAISRIYSGTSYLKEMQSLLDSLLLYRAAFKGFFPTNFSFNCTHWTYSIDTQKRQQKIAKCLGKTGIWGRIVYTNEDTVVGQWDRQLTLEHNLSRTDSSSAGQDTDSWVRIVAADRARSVIKNKIEVDLEIEKWNKTRCEEEWKASKSAKERGKQGEDQSKSRCNEVRAVKTVLVSYSPILLAAVNAGKDFTC